MGLVITSALEVYNLGTIKPTYIKTIALDMLREYTDDFSGNFDSNKQLVTQLTDIKSKKIRNRVAGYITRRMNRGRTEF